mmetsp:Transcript_18973/g.24647  ORF Transcript_18973/g.24647 Transcript_18973/m.24647 type:complete len:297 (-) Transcript_18973:497-1387(-)
MMVTEIEYIDFTRRLSTYFGSAAVQDKCLKLISYMCWFLSRTIKNRNYAQDNRLEEICKDLRGIYTHLFMARYATRLFGTFSCLEAIKSGSWGVWGEAYEYGDDEARQEDDDVFLSLSSRRKWLGKFMAWCMLLYYPCEHVTYAKWIAPKLFKRINAEWWSAWSCRFWGLYVIADTLGSIAKVRIGSRRRKQIVNEMHMLQPLPGWNRKDVQYNGHDVDERQLWLKCELIQWDKRIYLERLQLIRNALYCLPLLSWSKSDWERNPMLPEEVINSLCLGESIVCFWQSIFASFFAKK